MIVESKSAFVCVPLSLGSMLPHAIFMNFCAKILMIWQMCIEKLKSILLQ